MRYLKPLIIACTTLLAACSSNNSKNETAHSSTATTAGNPAANDHPHPLTRPAGMPDNIIIRSIATGDLNKDNLADSVIVTVDTAIASWPVTLKIFFATGNGYRLAVTTDKAISPIKPDGNDYGNDFDTATISAGVLTIKELLLRGHNDYKYRYQDGHFELIGYTSGFADGGNIYSEDYNLMTGSLRYEETEQETDNTIKKTNVHVKIQRPKLEEFEAGSVEVKSGDVDIYL